LQSGAQAPPIECKPDIQPVIEAGPKFTTIIKTLSRTTTSTGTAIYTTPVGKDFYLTFVSLCVTKDANSDNTGVSISIVNEGERRNIINLCTQSVTAGSHNMALPLPYPVKVDRNTAINIYMTFAAGTMAGNVTIGGFILE